MFLCLFWGFFVCVFCFALSFCLVCFCLLLVLLLFYFSEPRGLSLNILLLTFVTEAMKLNSKPQTMLWKYTFRVLTEFTVLERVINCEHLKSSKIYQCLLISCFFLIPKFFLVVQNGGNRCTKGSLWWPAFLLTCLCSKKKAFCLKSSDLKD